jgi:hypothetical protein
MIGMKKKDVQHKKPKGRIRRWLKANRMPLLSLTFVATLAGALTYHKATTDSPAIKCYTAGKCSIGNLSLEEKITVWRWRMSEERCGKGVMNEAWQEHFRQMGLGYKTNAKRIIEEINAFDRMRALKKCGEKDH